MASTAATSAVGVDPGATFLGRLKRLGIAPWTLLVAAILPAPKPGAAHLLGLPAACAFHAVTGLPCPGCGITRSVICCAHGAFGTAVGFHPLGPIVFLALMGMVLDRLAPASVRRPSPRLLTIAGFLGVALLLGVWIARLFHILPSPP